MRDGGDDGAEAIDGPIEVFAAGGVVVRDEGDGPLVLVVHRPRYDDWSLPKGKRDPGETDEECARREVEEESGLRCTLGAELPTVSYADHKGRPKQVRYWLMAIDGGAFVENDEVDAVEWLPPADAAARLSYAHDADVVRAALA